MPHVTLNITVNNIKTHSRGLTNLFFSHFWQYRFFMHVYLSLFIGYYCDFFYLFHPLWYYLDITLICLNSHIQNFFVLFISYFLVKWRSVTWGGVKKMAFCEWHTFWMAPNWKKGYFQHFVFFLPTHCYHGNFETSYLGNGTSFFNSVKSFWSSIWSTTTSVKMRKI